MILLIKKYFTICFILLPFVSFEQVKWTNVDEVFQPLPPGFHVYKTTDSLEGKPFIAYYAEVLLIDKQFDFAADTTLKRRLTPSGFFEKNGHPLLVVNTTFFSFATNQNMSVVIKDKKLVGYNIHMIPGRGKDTFTYRHPLTGAIGISRKRKADVAWIFTDSAKKFAYAFQEAYPARKDSMSSFSFKSPQGLKKWKMQTAVGGGPVLVQHGEIKISNNEEMKFAGKAINDLHPRTAMGYTDNGKLIVLVIQGRFPGLAEGASLMQEAQLLKDIGCIEALNLDGGGSSCMLINGKETIKPSDKTQRPVPAVFIIKTGHWR